MTMLRLTLTEDDQQPLWPEGISWQHLPKEDLIATGMKMT
jgi:hypothetical protein